MISILDKILIRKYNSIIKAHFDRWCGAYFAEKSSAVAVSAYMFHHKNTVNKAEVLKMEYDYSFASIAELKFYITCGSEITFIYQNHIYGMK